MPFHSTRTEAEAEDLVTLHCRLSHDGEYKVTVDWAPDDIMAAMASAKKQFKLK